jgi:hypothetical protein
MFRGSTIFIGVVEQSEISRLDPHELDHSGIALNEALRRSLRARRVVVKVLVRRSSITMSLGRLFEKGGRS